MKKLWIIAITIVMSAAMLLTGCNQGGGEGAGEGEFGLELSVVTSYGAEDGNRKNYKDACKAWERATGNTVADNSAVSNEAWKTRVNKDFERGTEPDVLFFFTGVDADNIINDGKVVSLEEIKAVYPDYGANMNPALLPRSTADHQEYVLPTTGFWEALFVNKKILADAGVAVPGKDYTWDQFKKDCATVKAKGYVPVAASLREVPHYWWEYTVLNNNVSGAHLDIPDDSKDATGMAWTAGMGDMKELYDAGFFPENTLTAKDAETCRLMADGKAAFAIDGSWKIGWILDNAADHLDDYLVTWAPGKGSRRATDIVGGISMGYYITRKAWEDPERQKAAVDFVRHMTSDKVLARFSNNGIAPTALAKAPTGGEKATPFVRSAIDMFAGQTGSVSAVQDLLTGPAREALFGGVKNVVIGAEKADALIDKTLTLNKEAKLIPN